MILAYIDDLLFRSKITATASAVGVEVDCRRPGDERDLPADLSLVLVDLQASGDPFAEIERCKQTAPDAKVIGFFPHVHVELKEQAKQAGADQILTRGQFTEQLAEILQGSN